MNKIDVQWQSYLQDVVPKTAFETQIRETRRAFYAGAAALMTVYEAISTEHVTVDDGVIMIEEVFQELQQFNQGVLEGRN
jgi:hypothetical protein